LAFFSFLIYREEFFENGESNKVASFAWTMEQYAYEIPVLLFQLEAFQYLFEKQLDMKSFKFGFTVVSSCVVSFITKISFLVQKSHFPESKSFVLRQVR
jgi:hypothetical protein